ncbi:MAG: V-type ATP synthase subunit F [Candidatus Micrarchaeaceae archaeon]
MEKVGASYKIAAIGSHSLELGFKIAGVTSSYSAESGTEAEGIIQGLMQEDDVGIIVITSRLAKEIRDRKISEAITASMKPLFIVVSDMNDGAVYEDNLRALIIRALGIDILKKR